MVTNVIKVSLYGVIRLQAGVAHFESDARTLEELRKIFQMYQVVKQKI